MEEVAVWKTNEVKQLVDIITSKPVIGLVRINDIPAPQIQQMRRKLRGKAIFRISKNRLFRIAFEEAVSQRPNINGMIEKLDGQMALIATDSNPFKLYQEMEATKMRTPAKGGEKAPEDISVTAGDTPFKPGPVVGELQRVGIPAAIESGKVVIKQDKLLVKKGEVISTDTAQVLKKLEIMPMVVGLDLRGVYEDGMLYPLDVLNIDMDEMAGKFQLAAVQNFNLAMNIGFMTGQTVLPLIQKAHLDAYALAISAGIITKDTISRLISKAHLQMQALKNKIESK